MTKEELKKEAEEYATKKVGDFKPIQEDKESEWMSCCEDFQKGAEFGYNKAKELKDQLEVFENFINDIPNVIDPCSQCEFKDRSIWDNLEKCRECCYYYSSNFKIETGKTKL